MGDYFPLVLFAVLAASAVGAYLLEWFRDAERKKDREDERFMATMEAGRDHMKRLADEAAALSAYQNEEIKCEGHWCIAPWQPRHDFWKLDNASSQRGVSLPHVCSACFFKITNEAPEGNPHTRRAFLALPPGYPVCSMATRIVIPKIQERTSQLLRQDSFSRGERYGYEHLLSTLPDLSDKIQKS